MMLMAMLLQVAAPAPPAPAPPAPSAEAIEYGTRLAATGTFARMVPLLAKGEADGLVKDHPELSEDERAVLIGIAQETAAGARDRIIVAMGRAYAGALSIDDLKAVVAFMEGPAAERWKAVEPQAVALTVAMLGKLDFRGQVLAAFCARTGKACPAR